MQIGQLPLDQFVRVVVAWMGLSAAPGCAGRRALDFAGFAQAAAILLCSTEATAYLFLREGGLRRCSQVLHDFQATPSAPFVRLATATLCMLQSTCGDVAAALIAGAHPGPSADAAPLRPPPWVLPTSTPRRFWSQPLKPDPQTSPAAPPVELGSEPRQASLTPVNQDKVAIEEAQVDRDESCAVPHRPGQALDVVEHVDVPMRRTLSSESLSENTSSLLGHSESSPSVTSGDDGADGPPAANPRPSLPLSGDQPGTDKSAGDVVLFGPSPEPAAKPLSPRLSSETGAAAMDATDTGAELVNTDQGHAATESGDAVAVMRVDGDSAAAEVAESGVQGEGDVAMQTDDTAGGSGSATTLKKESMVAPLHSSIGDVSQAAVGAGAVAELPVATVQESDAGDQQNGLVNPVEPSAPAGEASQMQVSPGRHANNRQHTGDAIISSQPGEGAAKRHRELVSDDAAAGSPSPAKRGRVSKNGVAAMLADDGMSADQMPVQPHDRSIVPVANGATAVAAEVAMVEAAVVAAGVASEKDPALRQLLDRSTGAAGSPDNDQDMLTADEEFRGKLQAITVPDAVALADILPVLELLERTLQQPQPRVVAALCALALGRLQVREALAAFAAHTETLIGEVQQGRIQFRHVDNSIIVVAEALRRLASVGEALERSGGAWAQWGEADGRLLRRLPVPRRGDACYVRCVAEHGVLRRCLQVLKLPALIVDSLIENGAELSGAERRSLHGRLSSHFVSPLRVRPNLLEGFVDDAVGACRRSGALWAMVWCCQIVF